tara:strand:+ start:296 stop:586 length:291 start_codon:yes stop_codon:yes gene_type:complete
MIYDDEQISEVWELLDNTINARVKRDAKPFLQRLRFISCSLSGRVDPYSIEKLNMAISSAEQASGQVSNKEHWAQNAYQGWHLFKYNVNRTYGDEE